MVKYMQQTYEKAYVRRSVHPRAATWRWALYMVLNETVW